MRRVRSTAVLLAALTIALVTLSAPSGASPSANPHRQVTARNLTVLDGDGNPLPAANGADSGVLACLPTAPPCAIGFADANGRVQLDVDPTLTYHVFGFARNTGWGCGGFDLPPDEWWFSKTSIDVTGGQLARPNTFVVAQPSCFDFDVAVHFLDGTETPLPTNWGGVVACTAPDNCVGDSPDANGHVSLALDPAVTYTFHGYAVDVPGWSCGYPQNGHLYWSSDLTLTGTPGQVNSARFVIYEPDPSSCSG